MSFLATFVMSLKSLRRNPTRTMLTALGIVIGIASVITMMEIGRGSSQAIQASIEKMGANTAMVMPGGVLNEAPEQAGLTRLLAETLACGCAKYPETEFHRKLELNAIDLNIEAGFSALTIGMTCPAEKISEPAETALRNSSADTAWFLAGSSAGKRVRYSKSLPSIRTDRESRFRLTWKSSGIFPSGSLATLPVRSAAASPVR